MPDYSGPAPKRNEQKIVGMPTGGGASTRDPHFLIPRHPIVGDVVGTTEAELLLKGKHALFRAQAPLASQFFLLFGGEASRGQRYHWPQNGRLMPKIVEGNHGSPEWGVLNHRLSCALKDGL
jgi:hypothetical protein